MDSDIEIIVSFIRDAVKEFKEPVVTEITKQTRDPYRILMSTIISLRTKDTVTREASKRLYELADTPGKMLELSSEFIEKAIYPAGFYKNKAKTIINISKLLITKYNGIVPDDIDELLTIKGVGRKTANLVVTMGYGKEGICVDTHVHRISNRLGYVTTKNPTETEFALREKLPKQFWIEYNDLLVTYGQNVCVPISPHCSQCSIHNYCKRIGVTRYR